MRDDRQPADRGRRPAGPGKLAAAAGRALVVDNTFASPCCVVRSSTARTVVIHSATKFLGGHHDLIGGVVCGSAALLGPLRELAREFGAILSPFNAWLALRGIATLQLTGRAFLRRCGQDRRRSRRTRGRSTRSSTRPSKAVRGPRRQGDCSEGTVEGRLPSTWPGAANGPLDSRRPCE